MILPNFYTETGLDRMSERRSDEDWIAGLLRAGETVVIPVWRGLKHYNLASYFYLIMLIGRSTEFLFFDERVLVLI